jgi:CheY-like chemotaxis protein
VWWRLDAGTPWWATHPFRREENGVKLEIMEAKQATILQILLVEDGDDDAFFFRHALEASGLNTKLMRVTDGHQAIAYLKGDAPFADRSTYPFPDMVVTDIKMPRASGFHLLEWLKTHQQCKVIPALVLSSSDQNVDVHKAYELGANAYAQKPATVKALGELLLVTYLFWSKCLRPGPPPDSKCG